MAKNVRFGEYLQAVTVDTASVAYGKLLPKPQFDAQGREIPQKVTKLNMSGADIVNLLQPSQGCNTGSNPVRSATKSRAYALSTSARTERYGKMSSRNHEQR